jgi:hypothetical protein
MSFDLKEEKETHLEEKKSKNVGENNNLFLMF